jgi:hypothetical protein
MPDPGKKRRIIIGVIGLLGFLTVIAIVLALLLATPTIRPNIVKIAAMNNEVTRIATLGTKSSSARRGTINLAVNVKSVSFDSTYRLKNWGDKNLSMEITIDELKTEKNSKIDDALNSADQINGYDEAFSETIGNLLTSINSEITSSYDTFAEYPELQTILSSITESNQILLDSIEN